MPYRCAKFETNRSTGRVAQSCFCKWCEEEEKGEENGVFSGAHISRTTLLISFTFDM